MKYKVLCITSVVIAILFCAMISPLKAQVLPAMTYGSTNSERAFAIVEATYGNGYVLAGWTKSIGPGTPNFSNVLVVRVDSTGIPMGAKVSIGTNDDEAYSMVRTFDGGYAMTGWTKSYGLLAPDSSNIFVIKLDSLGNQQWGWVYGSPFNEKAYSIIQTQDKGYAVTGWTNLTTVAPTGKPNIFLFRVDSLGAPMWAGIYWFPFINLQEEGYSVYEIPGAGVTKRYLIAGRAKVYYSNNYDAFIIQTNPVGAPLLATIATGVGEDEAHSVIWDGTGIVAAGWSNSFGPSDDIIVWKTDTLGNSFWGRCYGWPVNEERVMDDQSLIRTYMDMGYAVSGWTKSVGPGTPTNPNFLIMKLDTNGLPMWARVHPSAPGALTEKAYPMIITQIVPRGYAIAGYTNSFGSGADDFHLLTLDPQGNRPVCVIDTSPLLVDFPIAVEGFTGEPNMFVQMEPMTLIDTIVNYTEICSIIPGVKEWVGEITTNDFMLYALFENITVKLNVSGLLSLNLYDVMGRNVSTIAHGQFTKGTHLFNLPKNLSAGVYFVQADFEGIKKSTKVIRYQ